MGPKCPKFFLANRCTELIDWFTDFKPYILSVFSLKIVQMANSNGGIYGRYTDITLWNVLHCVLTNFVCVFVRTQINLIAYSHCFNWVNTQIRCLSGALVICLSGVMPFEKNPGRFGPGSFR